MSEITMPWGRHQGEPISALPSSYLHWLTVSLEDGEMLQAAEEELGSRNDHFSHFED